MIARPIIVVVVAATLAACGPWNDSAASTNAGTLAATGAGVPCELRVAWDPYEPYSYSDGGALPVGYDIEVVTEVAKIIGCSLTFEEMAWSDVLTALRTGEKDMAVGTGYKEDRSHWSWYSESYRDEVIGLLLRAGSSRTFAGESFDEVLQRGLVFGKTTDDTYEPEFEALFSKYAEQIRPRVGERENLQRLLDSDIDGFLVEINVGAALALRSSVADEVEFHPLAFGAGSYRLQMSKLTVDAAKLADINAALQQLAHSGWLKKRISSYALRGNEEQR
ncbi:MAG: transporter substrate-binding domain-containing protein [Pseudomonadota bacterium]